MSFTVDTLLSRFPPITHGVPSNSTDIAVFDWFSHVGYIHNHLISVRTMVIMAILYAPIAFVLQAFMKDKKALNLSGPLFYWNLTLSIFSGYAGYHVLTGLLVPALVENGWAGAVCSKATYVKPQAWWVLIFNYTKLFEWIDTLFLILRKRKIGFLHWFHHAVTMLYCLHASHFSALGDGSGTFFCGMNLFIHFLMYGYWAVVTIPQLRWVRRFGVVLTVLQTAQMFIGVSVLITGYSVCSDAWDFNWHGTLFGFGMYAFYFVLFFKLMANKLAQFFGSKNNTDKKIKSK